ITIHQESAMNRSVCRAMMGVAALAVLGMTATLAGSQTDGAMAQAPDAGCALPSEPKGMPAAIDASISGPADKDRACMKALLIPEERMMFVSIGADGTPSCTIQTWTIGSPASKPAAIPCSERSN